MHALAIGGRDADRDGAGREAVPLAVRDRHEERQNAGEQKDSSQDGKRAHATILTRRGYDRGMRYRSDALLALSLAATTVHAATVIIPVAGTLSNSTTG